MKLLVYCIVIVLSYQFVAYSNQIDTLEINSHLDLIGEGLQARYKDQLKAIAPYLDSTCIIERPEFYGSDMDSLCNLAVTLLKRYAAFKGIELTNGLSSREYLDFLDSNLKKIEYSDIIGRFVDFDIKEMNPEYELRICDKYKEDKDALENFQDYYRDLFIARKYSSCLFAIQSLGYIRNPETHEYILEFGEGDHWPPGGGYIYSNRRWISIVKALGSFHTIESLKLILDIVEKYEYIDFGYTYFLSLSKITNINPARFSNKANMVHYYRQLIDSMETIEAIRDHGYKLYEYNKEDYDNPIDFYKQIIAAPMDLWWLKYNAVSELISLHDPEVIPIIASIYYQKALYPDGFMGSNYFSPIDTIRKYTGVDVYVKGNEGLLTNQYQDWDAILNNISYWVNHYHEWKWDPVSNIFRNNKDSILEKNQYDVDMDMLRNVDDSLALNSMIRLGNSEPKQVVPRVKNLEYFYYWFFWRSNKIIHLNCNRIISTLVNYTELCRENNIDFTPDSIVCNYYSLINGNEEYDEEKYSGDRILFNKGEKSINEYNILSIQNLFLPFLGPKHISQLEYILCFESAGIAKNGTEYFLDRLYSNNWYDIISSDSSIVLYLKKAHCFSEYHKTGYFSMYLNKFLRADDALRERLRNISQQSKDTNVVNQIEKIFSLLRIADHNGAIPLDNFLVNIDKNVTEHVEFEPSAENFNIIVDSLIAIKDLDKRMELINLLKSHNTHILVPPLLRLINNDDILRTRKYRLYNGGIRFIMEYVYLSDYAVGLLERIYKHCYPKDDYGRKKRKKVYYGGQKKYYKSSYLSYINKSDRADYWTSMWENKINDYYVWDSLFFNERLDFICNYDSVAISDLNEIYFSDYRTEKSDSVWFKMICEIDTLKEIFDLKIDSVLNLRNLDLMHKTKNLSQKCYYLTRKNFLHPKRTLMEFELLVDTVSEGYQGEMLCKLSKDTLWLDVVEADNFKTFDLDYYLDGIEEYQEMQYGLPKFNWSYNNIRKNINYKAEKAIITYSDIKYKTLAEKFDFATSIDNEDLQRRYMKKLILKMKYEDLGLFFEYYDDLEDIFSEAWLLRNLEAFFGIGPNVLHDESIDDLEEDFEVLTEQQMYLKYSKMWYPQMFEGDEILYFMLYDAIQYDLSVGYSCDREMCLVPVIRLLELKYDVDLGIRNSSDRTDCVDFSIRENKRKLLDFLLEKGLVEREMFDVESAVIY